MLTWRVKRGRGGREGERPKMEFTVLIEWLIACLLFVTGMYTVDMISGHRREGKIYDLIRSWSQGN